VIVLNGERTEAAAGQTVVSVLALIGLSGDSRGVAVAVDGEVVPRGDWGTFALGQDACVEVLSAMQGG
jgi:sulfur carrier protein